MFYKFSRLAVLLVLSGLIVFFACRKNDLSSSSGSTNDEAITDPGVSLDVTLARKYFKILKNKEGAEVKSSHVSSLSATQHNFKHPYWQRAFTGETEKSTFVEVPLFYDRRITLVITKEKEQLDEATRLKIFNASFDRLLIYKNKKTGAVDQRIITYVPDADYLDKHGKDISQNRINHLDAAFKGYLVYRKWDGTLLSMTRINNGIVEKHLTGFTRQQNSGAKAEALVCTTYCTTVSTQNCYTSTSGEYTYTWCDEWSSYTVCWDECYDDGGGGGTGDPCIDNGNCGGGGGGGTTNPSPVVSVNSVINNLHSPCFVTASNALGTTGVAGFLTDMYNQIFVGTGKQHNIRFEEQSNLMVQGQNVPAKSYIDPNNSHTYVVVLNSDYAQMGSQEAWTQTILHEVVHGFLKMNDLDFKATSTWSQQHESMLNFWTQDIANTLMGLFNISQSDAYGLALGGIEDILKDEVTGAFLDSANAYVSDHYQITLQQADLIQSNYTTGSAGIRCN